MLKKLYSETENKMKKTVEILRTELVKIRTGRANPGLVEDIKVESYGAQMPLSQLASITVPEPRQLLIRPWDKNILPQIEKAILKSDLGLTPSSDGNVIRLNIPLLTEENRQNISKLVHRLGEENKIAIRNIRRQAIETIKLMKKEKKISEDDEKKGEEKIQKLTDSYIEEIDRILKVKDKEILES
ncbi:MAG: ribosome recycling factor [bacterium (Candidatus Stahlbacteria) CG23_combo_of_CG06-09_8_20_14_all_40_9]|nr:MAG: ribosome recycling factor [bacterium (Candidatus Stahlbacteria) CG23_combo_of_CG06-09_8_20_14_all_40_9]